MKERIIEIKKVAEIVIENIDIIGFIFILPLLLLYFTILAVFGDIKYNPTILWARVLYKSMLLTSIASGIVIYVQIIKGLIWLYLWMFW